MPFQFPYDCLNEIFEYLEGDKGSLYSCLLVNHLWCEISVRILWRHVDFYNLETKFNTLIDCLSDESKDLLHKNLIFISTPSSKPPLFNYASFCKVLSIDAIYTRDQYPRNLSSNTNVLLIQEIFKMFMKQTTLKKLVFYSWCASYNIPNFTKLPGAKDCLKDLSKLTCSSSVHPEFCDKLSQICHNLQSIKIKFNDITPNWLKHLISSQNSLKGLSLIQPFSWEDLVPSLMGCLSTLIKLKIKNSDYCCEFKELKHVTFSQLQILKLRGKRLDVEHFIKFLEINGKNLKEYYEDHKKFYEDHCIIHLAIAKFCVNLKSLYVNFLSKISWKNRISQKPLLSFIVVGNLCK